MNYSLRRMTYQDLESVWLMRNDEYVRRYTRHPEPIALEEHRSWFLSDRSTKLVFEVNYDVVGAVIFKGSEDGESCSWSIYKDPKISLSRMGTIMGSMALTEFQIFYRPLVLLGNVVTAEIHNKNRASIALHERLGFKPLPEGWDDHFEQWGLWVE